MIILNSYAQDMLKKACEVKTDAVIWVGFDKANNSCITINGETYLINKSNLSIAEAFEQLVNNGLAVRNIKVQETEYRITEAGYKYINENINDELIVM